MNFTPPSFHSWYHHINLRIEGKEPCINDIATIDILKEQTKTQILNRQELVLLEENLIAAIFYFRLTEVVADSDRYSCQGYIACRMKLPKSGHRALHRTIFDAGSYFIVNRTPVLYLKSKHANKPFRRQITFSVNDLDNKLYISLHHRRDTTSQISRLPRSVRSLADVQGLFAKFGRADHRVSVGRTCWLLQKRSLGTF
jgi:hypothetical protein